MLVRAVISGIFIAATVFVISCRSQQSLIRKMYSFSFQKQAGTIKQEDADGDFEKRDTFLVVYAESTTDKLQWDTAFINGSMYKIYPQLISTGTMEAGFDEKGVPVNIRVKEKHYLFQLQFERINVNIKPEGVNNGEQMIQFRYKNKRYSRKLESPLLLHQIAPV